MRSDSIRTFADRSKAQVSSDSGARPHVGAKWEAGAPPRIHFLYDLKNHPWGGANQFLRALMGEMEKKGACTRDASSSDAILFNLDPSPDFVERMIRLMSIKKTTPQTLVVARIAGPIVLARGRDSAWDKLLYAFCDVLADGVVFQSEWSRRANHRCGLKQGVHELVALNAPDASIFNAGGRQPFSRNRKMRLIGSSWSTNPRKGLQVFEWLERNLDFSRYEITFVGNAPSQFTHIRTVPPLASPALAKELKQHDVFLFPSMVEACSNSLVEALHCGLPAIAHHGSSNKEVVGKGGEFFDREEEIPSLLEKMAQSLESYQWKLRLPDIAQTADQYLGFVKNIVLRRKSGAYIQKRCGIWNRCILHAAALGSLRIEGVRSYARTLLRGLDDGRPNPVAGSCRGTQFEEPGPAAVPAHSPRS